MLAFDFGDSNCGGVTYFTISRLNCLRNLLNAHGASEDITTIEVNHHSPSRLARRFNLQLCRTQRGGGDLLVRSIARDLDGLRADYLE
jgi:hypothetical protein